MKSSASATTISPRRMPRLSCPSTSGKPATARILEDDALDDVGDVFAAIGDRFEQVVDHPQLHHLLEVVLLAEELRHRRAHDAVGVGLEPLDLLAQLEDPLRPLHVAEPPPRSL